MAFLDDLPPELIIIIYSALDNIDDALHLARTCKFMYNVLEIPRHRLDIFSRIIQNGNHHKYDIRLHAVETLCANFRNKHYNDWELPSISERPWFSEEFLECTYSDPTYKKLDPDTVWSIVCRWHALKLLFDLYCDSTVRPSYLRSIFWQRPDSQHRRWQKAVDYEIPLSAPSGETCRTLRSTTKADKSAAYERFYRAVCSHWLHVNITWLAGISKHTDDSTVENNFWKIDYLWYDNRERGLQEKIEAIEVTDFVWGFLARKIFVDPDESSAWILPGDLEHEPILWDVPVDASSFTRLVRLATFSLPPPHIIELLLVTWTPDSTLNRRLYLRKLGFFDRKQGLLEENGREVQVYSWFSTEVMTMIEWWGLDRLLGDRGKIPYLNGGESHPLLRSKWRRYRTSRWIDDLRGKPILYPETEEQLFQRIDEFQI